MDSQKSWLPSNNWKNYQFIEIISINHHVYKLVSKHNNLFFINQFIETISINLLLINHSGPTFQKPSMSCYIYIGMFPLIPIRLQVKDNSF
jgi:hypothetical protein